MELVLVFGQEVEKISEATFKIVEGETMIQSTVSRIESLIPPEQIFVVTNKLQKMEL